MKNQRWLGDTLNVIWFEQNEAAVAITIHLVSNRNNVKSLKQHCYELFKEGHTHSITLFRNYYS